MATGIKVYNADASLQFDLDDRLLRVLARINTGTGDGSAVVTGVTQGTVVGAVVTQTTTGTTPTITGTGSGVSWSFPPSVPANERRAVDVDIMVY